MFYKQELKYFIIEINDLIGFGNRFRFGVLIVEGQFLYKHSDKSRMIYSSKEGC